MTSRGGFFISFEGLDGAGKSTQVATLGAALRAAGEDVITVRPNDTALGEVVAGAALQHRGHDPLRPWSEALLFNAGRVQLISEVIEPALREGTIVIADRFVDSTLAYQGGGRGIDPEVLLQLHRVCCGDIWPQLTVYLDLPHELAARRQRAQQLPLDRFEGAPGEFHARVHATFERLAGEQPERIVRVDANRPAATVAREVMGVVRSRLDAAPRLPQAAAAR